MPDDSGSRQNANRRTTKFVALCVVKYPRLSDSGADVASTSHW